MRRRLALLLLLAMAVPAVCHAAEPRTITFLYSTDFHSAVAPRKATWLVGEPDVGGIRAFSAWIELMRRTQPTTFLFDSGDVFTGQAISTMTRGKALVDMWNAIGFDAACLGNHEFDYGVDGAVAYVQSGSFPVLSANLFYRSSGKLLARPYAIVERDGVKVGVIGIFGVDAVPSTGPAIWKTIEARDPLPILRSLVPELRRQVDVIVVLAHQGDTGPMQTDAEVHPEVQRNFDADIRTVESVPGIDVLIGGHAHRGIEVPWVSPKTGSIVVQTYAHGTTLGLLHLTVDTTAHKVVGHDGGLLRVTTGVFSTPQRVEAVVRKWEAEADRAGREVVGTIREPLTRRYDAESTIGDFVADALLWNSDSQIAFENSGGIREDLKAGDVTRSDLISALPFFNTVTRLELTGRQIRQILEQSLTLRVGLLQIAGMNVTCDLSRPEYQRVVQVMVAGVPLDDTKSYRVATNSFVAGGGDHYETFLAGTNIVDTDVNIVDQVVRYVQHLKSVGAPAGGRLIPAPAR
jgi:5'-nucleotidase / UDP-sugar diphosphatase